MADFTNDDFEVVDDTNNQEAVFSEADFQPFTDDDFTPVEEQPERQLPKYVEPEPKPEPELAPNEVWETAKDVGRVYPVAESVASFASGLAGVPIAGLWGLAHLPLGTKKASEAIEDVHKYFVYEPQTERGRELYSKIMYPFEKWHEGSQWAGRKAQDVTDSPTAGALVATAIEAAPAVIPMFKGRKLPDRALKATQEFAENIKTSRKEATKAWNEAMKKAGVEQAERTRLYEEALEARKQAKQGNFKPILEMKEARRQAKIEADKNFEKVLDVAMQDKEYAAYQKAILEQQLQTQSKKMALLEKAGQKFENVGAMAVPEKGFGKQYMAEINKYNDIVSKINSLNKNVEYDSKVIRGLDRAIDQVSSRIEQLQKKMDAAKSPRSGLIEPIFDQETGKWVSPVERIHNTIVKNREELTMLREERAKFSDLGQRLDHMYYDFMETEPFRFTEPKIETRFGDAKSSLAETTLKKLGKSLKEGYEEFKNKATREFEHLPKTKKFAPLRFELLRLQKQRDMAGEKAGRIIHEIVGDMDNNSYDLFTRKVILEDIKADLEARGFKSDISTEPGMGWRRVEAVTREKPVPKWEVEYKASEVKPGEGDGPFGFDLDRVNAELSRINAELMKPQNGKIQNAYDGRRNFWAGVREDYIAAMEEIGYRGIREKLSKENYFRRQVLDYLETKNAVEAVGKQIKAPTQRSFLKGRYSGMKDFVSDYIEAENQVLSQMMYDMELAKTIKRIRKDYDIKSVLVEEIKAAAADETNPFKLKERKRPKVINNEETGEVKVEWGTEYERPNEPAVIKRYMMENPEKYANFKMWQPIQGNIFYLSDSIPAQLMDKVFNGTLSNLGLAKEFVQRKLNVGAPYEHYIIPSEVAKTMDNLTYRKSGNLILNLHKKALKLWKIQALLRPKRFFKYNIRNLTGDAEATAVGNPRAFKWLPKAVKDITTAMKEKGQLRDLDLADYADWIDRGGQQATISAQEIGSLNSLQRITSRLQSKSAKARPEEMSFGEKAVEVGYDKAWKTYWRKARLSTDAREMILRYANYLEYLDQMRKHPQGQPKNFGASIPEEVMGLHNVKDRAYWLSNDLLGAYDRVSLAGQAMRENIYPFWSWKEVNAVRYKRLFQNALNDNELASAIGKKVLAKGLNPMSYVRAGKFIIKAHMFWGALELYNNTFYPDLEQKLPDSERFTPHIVLGEDDEGNIQYFNRIGVLGDIYEWVGLDSPKELIEGFQRENKSLDELAKGVFQGASNVLVQGVEPFGKLAFELITRRKLYPDMWRPGTVRERWAHFFQFLGWKDEYNRIMDKPHRKESYFNKEFESIWQYEANPEESAYYDILKEKSAFLKDMGKGSEGFFLTPQGNNLYNARLSLKYGDKEGAQRFMLKYLQSGGKVSGIRNSLERLEPLSGLNMEEKTEFLKRADQMTKDKLRLAYNYYMDLMEPDTEPE